MEYMHFGDSLESSLKDYGMICRKEKADQYFFIYKVKEKFEEGFIRESEIMDFIEGESGYPKKEIKSFLNKLNINSKDFIGLPILEKVYKLSEHFGTETILGKAITGLSFDAVLDILENE